MEALSSIKKIHLQRSFIRISTTQAGLYCFSSFKFWEKIKPLPGPVSVAWALYPLCWRLVSWRFDDTGSKRPSGGAGSPVVPPVLAGFLRSPGQGDRQTAPRLHNPPRRAASPVGRQPRVETDVALGCPLLKSQTLAAGHRPLCPPHLPPQSEPLRQTAAGRGGPSKQKEATRPGVLWSCSPAALA